MIDSDVRVRKYEPGLRYRRWQIADRFTLAHPRMQKLRRESADHPLVQQMIEIERECDEMTTVYPEFESMVKARLCIEFGTD